MRFFVGTILLLIVLLQYKVVFAGTNFCETNFSNTPASKNRNLDELFEDLNKLPPIILDKPSLKEGIERLLNDLGELKEHNDILKQVEELFAEGELSEVDVLKALENQSQSLQDSANEILNSDPTHGEARRLAEGYKLLLNKSENLRERAVDQYKENNQDAEGDTEQRANNEDQDAESSSSEQKSSKQSLEKSQETKSSKESKENKKQKPDESETSEDLKEMQQQMIDELKEQIEELQDKLSEEELNEKLKQELDKQDQESQDGQEESSESKPQDVSEDLKKEFDELEQQVDQMTEKQESSKGSEEKDRNEMQDALDEMKKELEEMQEGEGQESQPEQGDSKDSEEGKDSEQGESSSEEGKPEEGKSEEGKPEDGKDSDEKAGESAESESGKDSESKGQDGKPKMPKKVDNKTPAELEEMLKPYLDMLLARTLRNYKSSKQLNFALQGMKSQTNYLSDHFVSVPMLRQYLGKVIDIQLSLKNKGVEFESLSKFGQGISASKQAGSVSGKVKLKYMKKILDELQTVDRLTSEESETLKLVNQLLNQLEGVDTKVDDKDYYRALSSHFVGPLSKKLINSNYSNGKGEVNLKKLAADLKSGELNDVLLNSALRTYLDYFQHSTNQPKKDVKNNGPLEVINDSEYELQTAEDYSRFERFYRDIFMPLKMEVALLLGGELSEKVYKEERETHDPVVPLKKKASIVLLDISPSMSNDREKLRNALVTAFLDNSFKEVARGTESQMVYIIPFNSQPMAGEKVSTLNEAFALFRRLKEHPFENDGSTNIIAALERAFEIIGEHQKDGKELNQANVLLITDGDDSAVTAGAINKARKKMQDSSRVILNAIAMGQRNTSIESAINDQMTNENFEMAKYSFISHNEASSLLRTSTVLEVVLENAKSMAEGKLQRLDTMTLAKLRGQLLKLQKQKPEISFNSSDVKNIINVLNQKTVRDYDGVKQVASLLEKAIFGNNVMAEGELEKVQVLMDTLQIFSKSYNLTKEQILLTLPQHTKQKLKEWIKFK